MKKENTKVTAWLREQHAEKYIDDFFKAGYYDTADVTEDAIKRIVKEGGFQQRLLRSLAPKTREVRWTPKVGQILAVA